MVTAMPKTRNAFAFRDFDGKRILQRPYFRQFGFANVTDAEILAGLSVTDSDELAELEEKNKRLNDVFNRLDKLRRMVIQHANNRLEVYRQAIAKKLVAAQMDDETLSLQSRYQREQSLAFEYVLNAPQDIADLMISVKKLWQDSEQKLQAAYRRRFGERLKTAREKAGLTRKE
ncbi:MAG: hypothetical protein J5497_06280, partial [Selenomonadaceae bacterium]|nr:hypothetical protein [Selenomonadaceae bacterium]